MGIKTPHSRKSRPDQRSHEAAIYRRWYKTAAWRRVRLAQLRKEPLCRMCLPRVTPATTADHVVPHRGDETLFWAAANLQSLCEIHHGEKQRIEMGGREAVPVSPDGWPRHG